MKKNEIKALKIDELKSREAHLRGELFNLQFQHGSGQLENPKRIGNVKKEIARIKTIIREQLEAQASGSEV